MPYHYTSNRAARDSHRLPNVETFEAQHTTCPKCDTLILHTGAECRRAACGQCSRIVPLRKARAWFYWYCIPGCMPDSDPVGPFLSEGKALADARENGGDEDDDDDDAE